MKINNYTQYSNINLKDNNSSKPAFTNNHDSYQKQQNEKERALKSLKYAGSLSLGLAAVVMGFMHKNGHIADIQKELIAKNIDTTKAKTQAYIQAGLEALALSGGPIGFVLIPDIVTLFSKNKQKV
ncbi:MAG: hypothetical protein MZV64_27065 [Ignavibacteriales bacterium]|nr:hypothetical protein [Ignavibacteriales bacterium]